MHVATASAIAVLVVAAGCLQSEGPAPGTTVPMVPEPPLLLPGVRMESCNGVTLRGDVPADRLAAHLPAGLQPLDVVPGMGQVNVAAFRCPRTIVADAVHPDVAFLIAEARVAPDDSLRSGDALSFFVFDAVVTDASTAEDLRALGSPARSGSLDYSETSAGPAHVLRDWAFTAGDQTFRIQDLTKTRPDTVEAITHRYFLWSGASPLARLEPHVTSQVDDAAALAGAAAFAIEGGGSFSEAIGTNPPGWDAVAYHGWTWDLPGPAILFQNPTSSSGDR